MAAGAEQFDLVILGGGPGGYVAAIRAAQLGASVALVEEREVGGTCLNRGCIPTKALLASVQAYQKAKQATAFGFVATGVRVDYPAMARRKDEVVAKLVGGVNFLLNKRGVAVVAGRGRLAGPGRVEVRTAGGERVLLSRKIIVATGSRPAMLPVFGYDGRRVVTSDEALRWTEPPRRVLIAGGGAVGCEFASILAGVGSEVVLVELLPSLLPQMEPDVSRQLAAFLKRAGVSVRTGAKVAGVEKGVGSVTVQLAEGEAVEVDAVLVAVGRAPNSGNVGLETVGVQTTSRGEVIVDERMQTNVPGIYAIGDVTTTRWKLAHVASRQGIVAAENALGGESVMSYDAVPNVVFTHPEVASVGLTSREAEEAGIPVKSARFPFSASGKALSIGEPAGFVKVIAHAQSGQVLGVHMVGPQVTDLIAEATLAVEHRLTAAQISRTIHAHPTLPEAFLEAAEGIDGFMVHAL